MRKILLAMRSKVASLPVATWVFDTMVTGPLQSIFLIELSSDPMGPVGAGAPGVASRFCSYKTVIRRAVHGAVALHRHHVAGEHRAALLVVDVELVGIDLDRLLAGAEAAEAGRLLFGGRLSLGAGQAIGRARSIAQQKAAFRRSSWAGACAVARVSLVRTGPQEEGRVAAGFSALSNTA